MGRLEYERARERPQQRAQKERERYPFLAIDPTPDFVYEPLPEAIPDIVISDRRVRELVPLLEARTADPVWSGGVENRDDLLIWWKYWRGVESGKIRRPLPKSRRPITLPSLNGESP